MAAEGRGSWPEDAASAGLVILAVRARAGSERQTPRHQIGGGVFALLLDGRPSSDRWCGTDEGPRQVTLGSSHRPRGTQRQNGYTRAIMAGRTTDGCDDQAMIDAAVTLLERRFSIDAQAAEARLRAAAALAGVTAPEFARGLLSSR